MIKRSSVHALQLRGYSKKTIEAYCSQVHRFLTFAQQQNNGLDLEKMIQSYSLHFLHGNVPIPMLIKRSARSNSMLKKYYCLRKPSLMFALRKKRSCRMFYR
ncbi:phage integrase N-terminal SAM-like domain-containing protein [Paenibacillus sp. MDMC362]|uniref:phage integrase N-terminal SAM-like domain-containing protein n=1 Tax=Paenibacillus sp. MDMC362 TaxID=2977365 RepID=UPI000DC2F2F9|nr:hypothetical protein DP091_25915 [Paenibacillus sp. MDMC362]